MKQTIISIIIIIGVIVGVIFIMRPQQNTENQTMEQSQSELMVTVLQEGTGEAMLQPGQIAVVHYTGTLEDGVVFDSSLTRGQPFEFPYGTGSVITGWDQGLQNMKVGEKRKLVIPPAYGYGDNQVGPIPPNSTLIFEVELLGIQ
jgi:peptidylprolyl isomerase